MHVLRMGWYMRMYRQPSGNHGNGNPGDCPIGINKAFTYRRFQWISHLKCPIHIWSSDLCWINSTLPFMIVRSGDIQKDLREHVIEEFLCFTNQHVSFSNWWTNIESSIKKKHQHNEPHRNESTTWSRVSLHGQTILKKDNMNLDDERFWLKRGWSKTVFVQCSLCVRDQTNSTYSTLPSSNMETEHGPSIDEWPI